MKRGLRFMRYLWLEHVARVNYALKSLTTDLSSLRYFLLFVGNPRSGTTIVRTLLDAHPQIVLGNEVDILKYVEDGESWESGIGRIVASSRSFLKNPTWAGFNYEIEPRSPANEGTIEVIGDKKARLTTKRLMEGTVLLQRLSAWSPVPVRFIHCVRHPFDVISTRMRRNQHSLDYNVTDYFAVERMASNLAELLGPHEFIRVHLEHLIEDPVSVLRDVLSHLGLSGDEAYFEACRARVYQKPNQSRVDSEWTSKVLEKIETESRQYEHLSSYFKHGKLTFHEPASENVR